MSRKKKSQIEESTESLVEEVEVQIPVEETVEELREVVVPEIKAPQSFRSLKEAKRYVKENGGKIVEKGRFYVR